MPSSRIVFLRVMMYESLCVLVLVRRGPKIRESTAECIEYRRAEPREKEKRREERRRRAREGESFLHEQKRMYAERTSVSDG